MLVVGCGCRGRALAAGLREAGYAVRGTTRDAARVDAIEAAGAEGVVADPDRLATLTPCLEGVSVVCWLMGTLGGDAQAEAALHGSRLESLLGTLVDTPVRGFVYEGSGSVAGLLLEEGAALAQRAADVHRIPVRVVTESPAQHERWLAATKGAVAELLA